MTTPLVDPALLPHHWLVRRRSGEKVVEAMHKVEEQPFDPRRMRKEATRFGPERFLSEMREVVRATLAGRPRS